MADLRCATVNPLASGFAVRRPRAAAAGMIIRCCPRQCTAPHPDAAVITPAKPSYPAR